MPHDVRRRRKTLTGLHYEIFRNRRTRKMASQSIEQMEIMPTRDVLQQHAPCALRNDSIEDNAHKKPCLIKKLKQVLLHLKAISKKDGFKDHAI